MLEITQHTHPFERLLHLQDRIPEKNFHWWIRLLKNITPTQIQCRLGWAKFHEVCIAYDFDCPIPLLGLIGVTAYYLLRVVWQFSALQEIPPPLRSDLFKFDLPHKDLGEGLITHLQEKLNHITYARKNCPKQVVVWPTDLEGKMEVHHASLDYIHQPMDPILWRQHPLCAWRARSPMIPRKRRAADKKSE